MADGAQFVDADPKPEAADKGETPPVPASSPADAGALRRKTWVVFGIAMSMVAAGMMFLPRRDTSRPAKALIGTWAADKNPYSIVPAATYIIDGQTLTLRYEGGLITSFPYRVSHENTAAREVMLDLDGRKTETKLHITFEPDYKSGVVRCGESEERIQWVSGRTRP